MINKKIKGFGLIEVLVALAIMAVGLLAIGTFHSSLVSESSTSKNRGEAMALAQERIEQMRNYTDLALSPGDFDKLFVVSSEYGNNSNHQGSNSLFTRQDKVSENDDTKILSVRVTWEDASGQTEEVELSTEVAWQSPSLAGDLDTSKAIGPLVRSATGRAKLGKGQVSDSDSVTYTNGDTTGLLDRGDGDLRLTSGEDVVLTLEDACELDNGDRTSKPCTGFVEISGTVYIDRSASRVSADLLHVIASDAAYCQRYVVYNEGKETERAVAINSDNNIGFYTENKNYEYFNYTCYLGGGWHGNIGLLIDGPEWACMGDPTATDPFLSEKVAIRRVYRGMAHKIEKNKPVSDENGDTIYYSIGVADALILPEEGQAGHDFVVANLESSDASACTVPGKNGPAPMMQADANVNGEDGDLFLDVPTDFFCLNEKSDWLDSLKMEAFGYTADNYCPFDPSDPPSEKHIISGNLKLTYSEENRDKFANFWIYTSDGYDNCTINAGAKVDGEEIYPYSCEVYDWGNGWTGYVQITPDLTVFRCDQYSITIGEGSEVTADTDIGDFTCKDDSDVIDPEPDPEETLASFTVKGNIVTANGGRVDTISINGVACPGVTRSSTSYSCTTEEFNVAEKQNITIEYNAGNKLACIDYISETFGGTVKVSEGGDIATLIIADALYSDLNKGETNVDISFSASCN